MAPTKLNQQKIAILRDETVKMSILQGIERIGGIQEYIDEGDRVFIKFTLNVPKGYPSNANIDTIKVLIGACRDAGASKIVVSGFPFYGTTIKQISDILGLESFFKKIGADLAYLDFSDKLSFSESTSEKLKLMKIQASKKVTIKNQDFYIPKVVIESDKLISFNQVNVHPLFHHTSSILNSYSLISPEDQEIKIAQPCDKEYLATDQYKKDLASKILDIYSIKTPSLVINDLYYILEGAGPIVFKNSNLIKTGTFIIGNNSFCVDLITSNLLNYPLEKDELLNEAKKRNLGSFDLNAIQIDGTIDELNINLKPCQTNLSEIYINEICVQQGMACSGCRLQIYYLLNFVKTMLSKDIKYISDTSLLFGDAPPDPISDSNNIVVFGDCAIKSTKKSDFRIKKIIKKKKQKLKPNKNILEIHGCPPTVFQSFPLFLEHFRKNNMPILTLLDYISNQARKTTKNKKEAI